MKKSNVGSSILNKEINVEDYFFFLKQHKWQKKMTKSLRRNCYPILSSVLVQRTIWPSMKQIMVISYSWHSLKVEEVELYLTKNNCLDELMITNKYQLCILISHGQESVFRQYQIQFRMRVKTRVTGMLMGIYMGRSYRSPEFRLFK